MRGFDQRYQNGFDCQGLWIEVGVERELGLNSKREIEEYGLAAFAQKCREVVERSSADLIAGSVRLGQWMDWGRDYYTFSDTNICYIWKFLHLVHERGWLYRGHRPTEWCPRCGTSISAHEHLWQILVVGNNPDAPASVFLAGWPAAADLDDQLLTEVAAVRQVVDLGRRARASSRLRLRQPLRRLVVEGVDGIDGYLAEIADELRVNEVVLEKIETTSLRVRPNFPVLAPRLGRDVQLVKKRPSTLASSVSSTRAGSR
jgi:isoleucyl-tRNA synthetase